MANNKEAYNDMINRHTIYNIVANDLFPRIKFLDKTKDLKFSMEKGSICHYVFNLGKLSYKKIRRLSFGKGPKVDYGKYHKIKEW